VKISLFHMSIEEIEQAIRAEIGAEHFKALEAHRQERETAILMGDGTTPPPRGILHCVDLKQAAP
jgi:hypothetical protein